jgi:hypothetical protein
MSEGAAAPRQADNALVKALARAFRWKRMGPFAASTVAHQALGLEQCTSRLARVLCAIKVAATYDAAQWYYARSAVAFSSFDRPSSGVHRRALRLHRADSASKSASEARFGSGKGQ